MFQKETWIIEFIIIIQKYIYIFINYIFVPFDSSMSNKNYRPKIKKSATSYDCVFEYYQNYRNAKI